ncbi:REP-associated tyrosine transposase [Thalassotalea piscium]|uniref:REP element-mobilizing transposase RayT n=1 Tax=Thalassotalea piscium TaxID=1230533 RepID=A0A7X0NJ36_9GAMM|nr:transposase [Thalassotalea piscium]MBB6544398.1 REP element-mobilizing transposase RayT [Thalassotalea piscium]
MSWSDLRKGRYSHEQGEYFVTFNTHNKEPIFNDFNFACLFSQQLALNQAKYNCTWLTWVLMPDHFHGLLRLEPKGASLSEVVGGLKGSTSLIINKKRKRQGKFWQASFYDRALRLEGDRKNIARYIVANPLRRKLVNNIGYYSFWNSIYL